MKRLDQQEHLLRFLQIEILRSATTIILFLKLFCVILITMSQYFFFLYYKELKYLYILERPNKGYVIKDNNDDEKEQFVNKKEKIPLCSVIKVSSKYIG